MSSSFLWSAKDRIPDLSSRNTLLITHETFGKYDEDSTLMQHIQHEAVQMTNTAVLNTEDYKIV